MKGSKGHKYICHTNPKNVRFCDTILWNTSKMTCGVNIFPELEYKRPHKNARVAHVLEKHNNFIMDPMLGKGRCEIIHIAYVHLPCKKPSEQAVGALYYRGGSSHICIHI